MSEHTSCRRILVIILSILPAFLIFGAFAAATGRDRGVQAAPLKRNDRADSTVIVDDWTGIADVQGRPTLPDFPGIKSLDPASIIDLCALGNPLIDVGDTTYDGEDLVIDGCDAVINGSHSFTNLVLRNNATLAHTPTLTVGLKITLTGGAYIEDGSAIDLTGLGYLGGQNNGDPGDGPGGGTTQDDFGSGGGHGGIGGGPIGGVAYGDLYQPVTLGSGGSHAYDNIFSTGSGGNGGGSLHLVVSDTLTVDGVIYANGDDGEDRDRDGGGGSGGSIWIETGTLAGTGAIVAKGGDAPLVPSGLNGSSGGGGGRMAIYYTTFDFLSGGTIVAGPGRSAEENTGAGGGSIFLQAAGDSYGDLIVLAEGATENTAPAPGSTPLDGGLITPNEPHTFNTIVSGRYVELQTSQPLTIAAGAGLFPTSTHWFYGGLLAKQVTLKGVENLEFNYGQVLIEGPFVSDPLNSLLIQNGATLLIPGELEVNDLTLSGGSRLGHVSKSDAFDPGLTITATNITLEAESVINVVGRGYRGGEGWFEPGEGPGGGNTGNPFGTGGGYGGVGGGSGAPGGATYGDRETPDWLGSGGGSAQDTKTEAGDGGGRIRLIVSDTLHVDGYMRADGGSGTNNDAWDGGGGSGGSIWIEAAHLTGDGYIWARGGHSVQGGGGGGGRIAFYVDDYTFSGDVAVNGNTGGSGDGDPGTIWPEVILNVRKTAEPENPLPGGPVTYTLTVTNYGELAADVTITDTLPAQITPTGVMSWTANIAPGLSWTKTVTATVDPFFTGILSNRVDVEGLSGATAGYTLLTQVSDLPIEGLAASNNSPTVDTLATVLSTTVSSGTGVIYTWDFGDGEFGQGEIVSHLYPTAGLYTATVTATNSVGSVQTSTVVTITKRHSFSGLVFLDYDGDGRHGPGEPPRSGATVTVFGIGGPFETTSGSDGTYALDIDTAGWYSMTAELENWTSTTIQPLMAPLPISGSVQADFGFIYLPHRGYGYVSVRVWSDQDGDNYPDSGELMFPYRSVYFTNSSGTTYTRQTNQDGVLGPYDFVPGTYTITTFIGYGYFPYPIPPRTVTLQADQLTSVFFRVVPGGTVGGHVTDGLDGYLFNSPLIKLSKDDQSYIYQQRTSGYGFYEFRNVPPGVYTLELVDAENRVPAGSDTVRNIIVEAGGYNEENWTVLPKGTLAIKVSSWNGLSGGNYPLGGFKFNLEYPSGWVKELTTDYNGQVTLDNLPQPAYYTITPHSDSLPDLALAEPGFHEVYVDYDTSVVVDFTVSNAQSLKAVCTWGGTHDPADGFACTVKIFRYEFIGGEKLVETVHLPAGQPVTHFGDPEQAMYRVQIIPDDSVSGQENWPSYEEWVPISAGVHPVVSYPYEPGPAATTLSGYLFYDRYPPRREVDRNRELNWPESNDKTVWLKDGSGTVITKTTTGYDSFANSGYYEFTGLSSGDYQIVVQRPAGSVPTLVNSLCCTIDGLYPTPILYHGYRYSGVIDGRAFIDHQNLGEYDQEYDAVLGGLEVTLYDDEGHLVAGKTTRTDGTYQFSRLPTGRYYTLKLEAPPGMEGMPDLIRSVYLSPSVEQDFALTPPPPLDEEQDVIVFVDYNANEIFDAGDRPYGGLLVERYAADENGNFSVFVDAAVSENGLALFPYPDECTGRDCPELTTLRYLIVDDGTLLPNGLKPAPGDVNAFENDASVELPLIHAGSLFIRPFHDKNGNSDRENHETILEQVKVKIDGGDWQAVGVNGLRVYVEEGRHHIDFEQEYSGLAPMGFSSRRVDVIDGSVSDVDMPYQYIGGLSGELEMPQSLSGLEVQLRLYEHTTIYTASVDPPGYSGGKFYAYYHFRHVPPGLYFLSVVDLPEEFVLVSSPLVNVSSSNTVENLQLQSLRKIPGRVYKDYDGDGYLDVDDQGTAAFDLLLLKNDGSLPQTVPVNSDGKFEITIDAALAGSDPKYALTLDLPEKSDGSPYPITEAPGWFDINNHPDTLLLGAYPFAYDPAGSHSVAAGEVNFFDGLEWSPVPGTTVSYHVINDFKGDLSCGDVVLGQTTTNLDGAYRLVIPYSVGSYASWCIKVDHPSYSQKHTYWQGWESIANVSGIGGAFAWPRYDLDVNFEYHQPVDQKAGLLTTTTEVDLFWSAFRDSNANGVWDESEHPLAGTILSSGPISSTSPNYGTAIISLPEGLHELTISPPEGYATIGPVNRSVWISVTAPSLPPIGFRPDRILTGRVFSDQDGDGWLNPDEHGVGGITITLSGPVVTHTVSSLNGSFSFVDLPDDHFTLSAEVPAGYAPVADQHINLEGGGVAHVPVQPLNVIGGLVYHDWDNDTLRGLDELIPVMPITVTIEGASTPAENTHLAAGRFAFLEVSDDTYTVTSALAATEATQLTLDGDHGGSLALPAVEATIVRGTAWLDENRDDLRQPWETPLAGITVTLDLTRTATTDRYGRYIFWEVDDGPHTIKVDLPGDLEAVIPGFTIGLRGAAVGIPAVTPAGPERFHIFLPSIMVRD